MNPVSIIRGDAGDPHVAQASLSHQKYMAMPLAEITAKLKQGGVFTDVKSAYDQEAVKAAGFKLWRL
ncbi:MAG: hypothetical protein Q8M09_19640 [Pseudomonadota bacterium]|nr:hypothetical protein [Pseudomonadota bacterium]MDP2351252.1 hypothetical protein [Pseudomonadota bacterium]